MKFLAIIEVAPDRLIFQFDRATVVDASCVPGGVTQEMMKDMALMVDNKARATDEIKSLWSEHEEEPL